MHARSACVSGESFEAPRVGGQFRKGRPCQWMYSRYASRSVGVSPMVLSGISTYPSYSNSRLMRGRIGAGEVGIGVGGGGSVAAGPGAGEGAATLGTGVGIGT